MAEPFGRIKVCRKCGCVFSAKRATSCPVCKSSDYTSLEDPSD